MDDDHHHGYAMDFSEDAFSKVRSGMSFGEVTSLLGHPSLVNDHFDHYTARSFFKDDEPQKWAYAGKAHGCYIHRDVFFDGGRVVRTEHSYEPD